MTTETIPSETIKQYLTAANSMLTMKGFTHSHGKTSAPRTTKADRAFIYTHPKLAGEVWVSSNLNWSYKATEAHIFSVDRLVTKYSSNRLSDLKAVISGAKK